MCLLSLKSKGNKSFPILMIRPKLHRKRNAAFPRNILNKFIGVHLNKASIIVERLF
jgi:hypothetical protein